MPKFSTKDITTPKDGLVVRTNSYWICENGDTSKALFYDFTPQCNSNKSIVESFINKDFWKSFSENLQVVFVEVAYVPNVSTHH